MANLYSPNPAKQAMIRVSGKWFIVQLGLVKLEGKTDPVWCEEDGSVVCKIGDEDLLKELPDD